MCVNGEKCCGDCAGAGAEPSLMRLMTATLGIDGLMSAADRRAAGERCADCADKEACAEWLDLAALRGAEHAPSFCVNADGFDALASEAPSTL